MSPIGNNYAAHTSGIKQALRNAAKRCKENGITGRTVTVRLIGLTSTTPPKCELLYQTEEAIDLNLDDLVFFPKLAQLGVPCAFNNEEYSAFQANEFVAWMTRSVKTSKKAYDILEPYHKAILNLP